MKVPNFLLGSIDLAVPRFMLYCAFLGLPVVYAGALLGQSLVVGLGLGLVGALVLNLGLQLLMHWRFKRKFRNLPVSSVVQRSPDGLSWVAIVTKMDGTIVTVELPGDYDPSEDGGRRLMAEVAPELLNLIYEEE